MNVVPNLRELLYFKRDGKPTRSMLINYAKKVIDQNRNKGYLFTRPDVYKEIRNATARAHKDYYGYEIESFDKSDETRGGIYYRKDLESVADLFRQKKYGLFPKHVIMSKDKRVQIDTSDKNNWGRAFKKAEKKGENEIIMHQSLIKKKDNTEGSKIWKITKITKDIQKDNLGNSIKFRDIFRGLDLSGKFET